MTGTLFQTSTRFLKKQLPILVLALLFLATGLWQTSIRPATAANQTSLAVDGETEGTCPNFTSSCSATLTTQQGNDIVVVFVIELLNVQGSCTFSVSDSAGLSWAARTGIVFSLDGREQFQEFWARSVNPLSSDLITESILGCGTNYNAFMAFGISGANFGDPFDPNSALPSTATGHGSNSAVLISTSNSHDMIFAGILQDDPSSYPTSGSGFSLIPLPPGTVATEYKIVDASVSNLSVTFNGSAGDWLLIADAVQGGPTAPPALSITPSSGTVGTMVLVQGSDFPVLSGLNEVLITFDDQLVGFAFAQNGNFNFTFNVPQAQPGPHTVKALEPSLIGSTIGTATIPFLVLANPTSLTVSLNTGTIYFPGDTVTVFILITRNGDPVAIQDLSLTVQVVAPSSITQSLSAARIAVGLYNASYAIPRNNPLGTYSVLVIARSPTAGDSSALASFETKPTWLASHAPVLAVGASVAVALVAVVGLIWQKGYFKKLWFYHPDNRGNS